MLLKKTLLGMSLLAILLSPLPLKALDFSLHGYYRVRTAYYHDLDTQRPSLRVNQGGLGDNDRFGSILFNQQRLRLEPTLKVNDNLSLHTQLDVLDNILFGTKEVKHLDFHSPIIGTIQLPGAGGAIGMVGGQGGENETLNIRRVYMDIMTPGGKIRIGRQPSQFGLGVFSNDGNGPEGDFGDTYDRFLYLAGLDLSKDTTVNVGFVADIAFTEVFDPRIDGLGAAISSPQQDMYNFGALILLDHPNLMLGGTLGLRYRNGREGETTTTARQILVDAAGDPVLDDNQNYQTSDPVAAGHDGNTKLFFTDLYADFKQGPFRLQGEYVLMWGKLSTGIAVDAIPFNNLPASARGAIEMLQQNDIFVQMGALEARYSLDLFGEYESSVALKGGYASGDARPLSSKITQYGFRPDYHVALLMFRVPLGSSPRITQANGNGQGSRLLVGAVPVTGNTINNAFYGVVELKQEIGMSSLVPMSSDVNIGFRIISAWAPSNNFDIDFAEMTGFADLPTVVNSNKWYGFEVDALFEARFFKNLRFLLEAGYLLPGPAYDVEVQVFNPTNLAEVNTIPFDGANWVMGIRSSMSLEF